MPNNRSLVTRFGPSPLLDDELATKGYVDAVPSSGNTFARVVKKVDQTKTADTTLADDDELVVALEANKMYGYFFVLFIISPAAADYKIRFDIPAGATSAFTGLIRMDSVGEAIDAEASRAMLTSGINQSMGAAGRVVMAGTAGNLAMQWAQNSSNAGNTITQRGSYLVVWEELP